MHRRVIGSAIFLCLLVTAAALGAAGSKGGGACRASAKADRIVLTAAPETCAAKGGDDALFGRGGGDRLKGGPGEDKVSGEAGDDQINGDAGPDQLLGGPGNDQISDKGIQADRATAGAGNDQIDLRDGIMANDEAVGGPGTDICLVDALDTVTECENPVVATPRPPGPPTPQPTPEPPKPPTETPGPSKLQIGAVTDTPDPTHFGEEITFTVLVENTGPGTATGVNLHASKASGFNRPFVEFKSPSSCTFAVDTQNDNGTADCPLANIAPGASTLVTLSGKVTAEFTDEVIEETYTYQFIATASNASGAAIGSTQNKVVNR